MEETVKILVIDDDEVDRISIKRSLKATGISYTLQECESPDEAIRLLKADRYDCVFLDYMLPGTDGLTVLRYIKSSEITSPIVIITSQGDEKIAVEMMKSGASDYITKDQLSSSVVQQIIRNVLRIAVVEKEREAAVKALKISQSRLAEAQSIAKIGNWEFSFIEKKIYWSEEVFRIFERDPEFYQPDFRNYILNYHPDDRDMIKHHIREGQKGKTYSFDFRALLPDGNIKYAHAEGYPIFDADGKVEKIIGTVQDITERKNIEKELIVARKIAEESKQVKEQFLANMSHEIRTPMNAIIGFTQLLLKNGNIDEEQKNYLDAIHHSGENLLVIINDILDFSKIESGKLVLERIDFSLDEVINPVLDLFRQRLEDNGIELIFVKSENVPDTLKGDPTRLNQVLINFFSNAYKFTEKGYIKLEITINPFGRSDTDLLFRISDTGIGIQQNKLDTIFDSFTQARSDTTRKYGGTGLGLSIVKNIVELQGGKIQVFSEIKKGTEFIFNIPFGIGNLLSIMRKEQEEIDTTKLSLKNSRILVVEDNELNQLLTFTILGELGAEVDIAKNGSAAIDMLEKKQYDVILMDVQMPEMDGYEATSYIRSNFPSPVKDIPIIAMTAHALSTEPSKCFKAGMNDYLSKPFKAKDLFNKIARFTGKENPVIHEQIVLDKGPDRGNITDLDYLYDLSGGNAEFIKEMINLFLDQIPDANKKLKENLDEKNWEQLKELSHKIKSSYALMGATKITELMLAVEIDCIQENIDIPAFNNRIDLTIKLSDQAIAELKQHLKTLN